MIEPTAIDPLRVLGGLLFTLVGPVKMMPVFYARTATMDTRARAVLAVKAAALAALGIAIAGVAGTAKIADMGISREALGTATGLVLAIIGLMPLIGVDLQPASKSTAPLDAHSLAFPTLVPPYAFGLIILISLYMPQPDGAYRIAVMGVVLMAINTVAMITAQFVLGRTGMMPLRVLGAVFGILQLALGIQLMFWGIANGIAAV